jgi:membrane protease YdiL (CAAX protease family)
MTDLGRQLARMMWWQNLASYPLVALLCAALVAKGAATVLELADERFGPGSPAASAAELGLVAAFVISVASAVAILLCWVVTLCCIFQAGRTAFGLWSGCVYAGMGFVLAPFPGLYVIPHMVRLDVERLLGVQPAAAARHADDE